MLYLIPFLHQTTTVNNPVRTTPSCILFHFYIKPQRFPYHYDTLGCCILFHFYIKPQRVIHLVYFDKRCILFHFYIKPQLVQVLFFTPGCCILFHFYIKPQPVSEYGPKSFVVSYSISTSNHNLWRIRRYFQAHYHLNHILIFNGML